MKTKRMSYSDHGLSDEEVDKLIKHCRNLSIQEKKILLDAAEQTYKMLANEIWYSLTNGISYDRLYIAHHIPLSKGDFYGYRRKTLGIFKTMLIQQGVYKF